jgi:hypothetical protein
MAVVVVGQRMDGEGRETAGGYAERLIPSYLANRLFITISPAQPAQFCRPKFLGGLTNSARLRWYERKEGFKVFLILTNLADGCLVVLTK